MRLYRNNSGYDEVAITASGLTQIRFLVHGVDVSGWLALDRDDFTWNLHIDNPGLNGLADGLHDISTEVQGPARDSYKPAPIFVHVTRGRAVSDLVPIMAGIGRRRRFSTPARTSSTCAPPIASGARIRVEPEVEPFHEAPDVANTFGELMSANAEWSTTAQMWWEELPHALPFVRALAPKLSNDDHRFLRVGDLQERLPFKDGGRGIGWMGALVTGQVDARGRFAFAEAGGRVGYLMPDGEIVTVAGWRVRAGQGSGLDHQVDDADPRQPGAARRLARRRLPRRDAAGSARRWTSRSIRGTSTSGTSPPTRTTASGAWSSIRRRCVGTVTVFAGDPDHSARIRRRSGPRGALQRADVDRVRSGARRACTSPIRIST